MKSRLGLPALILLGTLLVQAAWILAVPPFRGSDEFDHAYRAVAVAHGEWRAHGTSPEGRGGLVTVTPDIVAAAHRQCAALKYTGRTNCAPAQTLPDGRVRVASGASSYNPVYYWIVGTVARPFDGAGALYAMRAFSALLCALGIAIAAWCAGLRLSGPWPVLGVLVAVTPVAAYSTAIAAPNGLEIVAGLLLWSALLAIDADEVPAQRSVIAIGTLAAVVLVTLRTLGPLFAVLIALCVLLARRPQLRDIWTVHRARLLTGLAITTVSTLAAVYWTLTVQGATPGSAAGSSGVATVELHLTKADVWRVIPVGILQAIAAFPLRDEAAPIIVYPCFALVGIALLVVGWRSGSAGSRRALAAIVALSVVVPVIVSLPTLESDGLIWQGRYGLPFSVGMFVVAGWWVTARGRGLGSKGALALVLLAVAHVVSLAGVAVHEHGSKVSAGDPNWFVVPTWALVALGVAGCATCAFAVRRAV